MGQTDSKKHAAGGKQAHSETAAADTHTADDRSAVAERPAEAATGGATQKETFDTLMGKTPSVDQARDALTEKVERIARVCHAANRAYALVTGEDPHTIHPEWPTVNEEIRESARIGVRHALDGATPEQLHEAWCDTKRAAGWTYSPVRDNTTKLHPNLLPYDELPTAQRKKDLLFSAIVNALR
jgi:hypothetical protein